MWVEWFIVSIFVALRVFARIKKKEFDWDDEAMMIIMIRRLISYRLHVDTDRLRDCLSLSVSFDHTMSA